jgi:hypothetical protein
MRFEVWSKEAGTEGKEDSLRGRAVLPLRTLAELVAQQAESDEPPLSSFELEVDLEAAASPARLQVRVEHSCTRHAGSSEPADGGSTVHETPLQRSTEVFLSALDAAEPAGAAPPWSSGSAANAAASEAAAASEELVARRGARRSSSEELVARRGARRSSSEELVARRGARRSSSELAAARRGSSSASFARVCAHEDPDEAAAADVLVASVERTPQDQVRFCRYLGYRGSGTRRVRIQLHCTSVPCQF